MGTRQTCTKTGKRVLSKREAQDQVRSFRRLRASTTIRAYKCKACGGWHVGNMLRKPKQRRR